MRHRIVAVLGAGMLAAAGAPALAGPAPVTIFAEDFARARPNRLNVKYVPPGRIPGSIFFVGAGTVDIAGLVPNRPPKFGPCLLPPAARCADMIGDQPPFTPTEIHTVERPLRPGHYVVQLDARSTFGETIFVSLAGFTFPVTTGTDAQTVALPFALSRATRSALSLRLPGSQSEIYGPIVSNIVVCRVPGPEVTRCR